MLADLPRELATASGAVPVTSAVLSRSKFASRYSRRRSRSGSVPRPVRAVGERDVELTLERRVADERPDLVAADRRGAPAARSRITKSPLASRSSVGTVWMPTVNGGAGGAVAISSAGLSAT